MVGKVIFVIYNQKMRSYYIDILKAFAIFLVILGHNPLCSNVVKQWIYTFHMPVFFAAYGLAYDMDKHYQRGFLNSMFIVQKAKRLLLPAILWALIYASLEIKKIILILYGSQQSLRTAGSLSSIWFLPCMFLSVLIVEVVMLTLNKLFKGKHGINISIFCLSIGFSLIAYFIPSSNNYPWSINIVPMACSFMLVGYLLQKIIKNVKKFNNGDIFIWALVFILSFAVLTSTYKYNLVYININNVDMASGTYGNYILYMLDASCGIMMLIALAVFTAFLQKSKLALYIGRNTLSLFLIHNFVYKIVALILQSIGMFSSIIYIPITVIVVIICCTISKVIDIILPSAIGNVSKIGGK